MIEIELKNGARLRARPVPPHVYVLFRSKVNARLPQVPDPPAISVKMADGHSEDLPAGEESPEWEAYQEALAEYEREQARVMDNANHEYNTLLRDYAVISWTLNGNEWHTDAPDGWTWEPALARAGLPASDNERVDYISLELLTTPADLEALHNVAEGGLSDITDEEVSAVRAGFRPGDRRERHRTAKKQGWLRRLAFKISRRDGSG